MSKTELQYRLKLVSSIRTEAKGSWLDLAQILKIGFQSHIKCKECGHILSRCKKRNACNYCKKLGHIILECNRRPNSCQTKHKAHQVFESYGSHEEITPPSSLDSKALQKMIQESVTAALLEAIFCALTVAYPESGDREGDRQGS